MPHPPTRQIILAVALAGLAAAGLGLGHADAQDAAATEAPAPKLLAEFDIPRDGSLIVLPLTFKGKTYRFLLDTGAQYTTFDEAFAPLLGEPKELIEGKDDQGKDVTIRVCYAPDAKLGPLSLLKGGPVMCFDLAELRRLSGLKVHGVIGMALLQRYMLQFDFDAGKLRCYQPDSVKRPAWGEIVPMRTARRVPVVPGHFGKSGTLFAIHSGYPYTGALGKRFFKLLQNTGVITDTAETLVGTLSNSSQTTLSARVKGFQINDIAHGPLVFDRNPDDTSLLGMGWLKRYNATFDFRNSRLYLRKSHLFDAVDQQDMSGLHLVQAKKGGKVHLVDPGSPAARAGIKAGDIILKLDGQWVVKMSLAEARRMLRSKDGRAIKVLFQRGEQGYKTTLTLKQQI